MQNSDKQNARIELLSDHTELFKQFSDNPSFKKWLSETIFAATYASKAAEVEDSVPANEVKTPSSARVRGPRGASM